MENVSKELDCVMSSGYFELVICPKRIAGSSQTDDKAGASEVLLHYQPMKELVHRKYQSQSVFSDLHSPQDVVDCSMTMLPSPILKTQPSVLLETWNSEQIDDFVRKLGFLEAQTVEQPVKRFQQMNQVCIHAYTCLYKIQCTTYHQELMM